MCGWAYLSWFSLLAFFEFDFRSNVQKGLFSVVKPLPSSTRLLRSKPNILSLYFDVLIEEIQCATSRSILLNIHILCCFFLVVLL